MGAVRKHDPQADGCEFLAAAASRWHAAYCRWYDHDRAGNRVRAAVWGFIADRIVRWA